MRLFGILLIVVILLAGGGYVYLGVQDYKGRQNINAAGLRHLLVLQGLPLDGEDFAADDETPFKIEMAGGESSRTVSKKLLENYFKENAAPPTPAAAATPGVETAALPRVKLVTAEPVTSQVAETKRVFALLKGELDKAAAPDQKAGLVMSWLLLQAETFTERSGYLALASATTAGGAAKTPEQLAADADELAHQLDRKFYRVVPKLIEGEAALAPEKWKELQRKIDEAGTDTPAAAALKPPVSTDEADRRGRLAHLLTHLDTDAAWQKRVGLVVGLRRYVRAVATQSSRFREMRDQVELPNASDQATFQQHQDALLTEARQNVEKARFVAEDKAKRAEQKTAADDAVNRRRTQIKELAAQLKKVRDEVDDLLVQQSGNTSPPENEKLLYEIQVEVALTLDEVYRLETLLADVERERYGIPPRR